MSKKVISLVLSIIFVLSLGLSGCSTSASNKQASTSTAAATNPAQAVTNPFTGNSSQEFYMVTFVSGYPFWKDCYNGFKAAGDLYGIKTVYGGTTEYDVNAAITALDQIIAKKPAGIAVSCMDAKAYAPSINKAIEAGIPVITFDSDSPSSKRISFIGTQNYAAGVTAARYIGQKMGGKGKVAALTTIAQTNIKERTDGFSDTIKKEFPGIQLVQVADAGTDQVAAAAAAANLLKSHPDVQYFFCALASASIGAQQALTEASMKGKVKIVAFDTDKVTLDAIKSGDVDASISQAPWAEGFWAMNYLYFIKNNLVNPVEGWQTKGYPAVPQTADSGSAVVTKDNADNFYTPDGK